MKRFSKRYPALAALALCAVAMSCTKQESPLSQEQYKKMVYLVGASQSNNQGLQVVNLPYKASTSDAADTYISVATGGSLLINKNLTVQVAEAGTEAIQQYNRLYLFKPADIRYQLLNSTFYSIPDFSTQIKAGQAYANMPVKIKTANLHCDSLYALSFKINSLSDPGYAEIRKTDSILLFSFNLYNDYSGIYQETGRYYKTVSTPADTVPLSLTRTLKAVDYNSVRFYHLASKESVDSVTKYGVNVKVNTDNSLTVTPWGNLTVTAGGGRYDPVKKLFSVFYTFISNGVSHQFKGDFVKSL